MTALEIMESDFNISNLSNTDKIVALRSRLQTLKAIETYPCNCEKSKMKDLFNMIKTVKFETEYQLKELTS